MGMGMMDTMEERPVANTTTRARVRDFDTFFRQEADGVFRALAATLRDRDLAEEAAAEAMTRTYQHWRRVRRYDNPAGWAYRVGLNWARSRLRRRDVTRRLRPPDPERAPEPFDDQLHEALLRLEIDQRAVVVLRYLYDWSQEQIAEALDLPVGTVKSRLGRAVARLRETLEVSR